MSDAPLGPEWWMASDGKWYPPAPAPPPPPKQKKSPLIPIVICVSLAVIVLFAGALSQSADKTATTAGTTTTTARSTTTTEATPTTKATTTTVFVAEDAMDFIKVTMCADFDICGSDADMEEMVGYACDALDEVDPRRNKTDDEIVDLAATEIAMTGGTREEQEMLASILGMVIAARDLLCV